LGRDLDKKHIVEDEMIIKTSQNSHLVLDEIGTEDLKNINGGMISPWQMARAIGKDVTHTNPLGSPDYRGPMDIQRDNAAQARTTQAATQFNQFKLANPDIFHSGMPTPAQMNQTMFEANQRTAALLARPYHPQLRQGPL
jgi:hypothetical protein